MTIKSNIRKTSSLLFISSLLSKKCSYQGALRQKIPCFTHLQETVSMILFPERLIDVAYLQTTWTTCRRHRLRNTQRKTCRRPLESRPSRRLLANPWKSARRASWPGSFLASLVAPVGWFALPRLPEIMFNNNTNLLLKAQQLNAWLYHTSDASCTKTRNGRVMSHVDT